MEVERDTEIERGRGGWGGGARTEDGNRQKDNQPL